MRKYQISCPIVIKHLPSHERCKDELMSLVNQSPGRSVDGDNGIDKIISTDFFFPDSKRLYEPLFLTMAQQVLRDLANELVDFDYTDYKHQPGTPWYQQYQKNDIHCWHDHAYDSTFSIVYYLELPRGTPGTEFLDPFTKRVHKPRVKEGDMLIFPSFVSHRSPPNQSNQRKTIISMNFY